MRKTNLLSAVAQVILLALISNTYSLTDIFSATCTGSDPCNACKNCKYCRHCAQEGGKCGVCK
jgi:hypothetical protein